MTQSADSAALKLLESELVSLLRQLRRMIGIELALRLQTKVMQVSHAINDLRVEIAACQPQATRRGFDAVQIDEVELRRRGRGRNR